MSSLSCTSARAGFTLVEVMVALILSLIILAGFSTAVITSQRVESNLSTVDRLENDANEAISRIADELRQAGAGSPGWSLSSNSLSYNLCTGASGSLPTWGGERAFVLTGMHGEDPTDGVDNNSDGLIDEGMLVLSGGGIWEPLATDIAQNGLVFTQSGNDITITLGLERLNEDSVHVTTWVSPLVSLRN